METLFQPRQQNEEASGLHDEFLDLAVHELDAPLRKLMLLTERLEEKCKELSLPDDLHPYLGRISHCASNMRSLIDDLQQLTDIRSNTPEFSTCNLEEIVGDALGKLKQSVDETKATVTMDSLPELEGDKELLIILFKNLLQNSIRFAANDTAPAIVIRSTPLSAEQKDLLKLPADKIYHRIELTDNGIGFKEADAQKILQPFVSLHGKSKNDGNGMGLAICEKIVAVHNGIFYAEGNEGKGATFILILPQTPQ